jgi:hypothetical protein
MHILGFTKWAFATWINPATGYAYGSNSVGGYNYPPSNMADTVTMRGNNYYQLKTPFI